MQKERERIEEREREQDRERGERERRVTLFAAGPADEFLIVRNQASGPSNRSLTLPMVFGVENIEAVDRLVLGIGFEYRQKMFECGKVRKLSHMNGTKH